MPQVVIKRSHLNKSSSIDFLADENLGAEITVTGDQVIVNSDASVKVTFSESEIIVDVE